MNVSRYVKRYWIWLRRIKHRKGFGVQSPYAYTIIREIINNKEAYYAYDRLHKERTGAAASLGNTEKEDKLLFRLSNFAQPSIALVPECMDPVSSRYIKEGCKRCQVIPFHDLNDLNGILSDTPSIDLACISNAKESVLPIFNKIKPYMKQTSVLIVGGIHRDKEMVETWRRIQEDPQTGITFDLYGEGIVFWNSHYAKQHYIVNF